MSTIRLLHITPELPPTVGGIADYTAVLSRRLVEVSEGNVLPTLIRAGWKGDGPTPETEFNTVDCTGECNPAALARTIQEHANSADHTVVLLQYSGYGYAQRGAPWWLMRGLQQACEEASVPLITMFHELYATGPPWTSAFWLSPAQRYIAARLARMSQAVVTNRAKSADWLRRYVSSDTSVHVQPVFSNVGEPDEVLPYEERNSYAVVFGGTGKNALYRRYGEQIAQALEILKVPKLIDIGPAPDEDLIDAIGCESVEVKGFLAVKEIQHHLMGAKAGFVCRNPEALTKSGSLAAYAAYGVPTFIGLRDSANSSQLWKEGVHYHALPRGASGNDYSFDSGASLRVGESAHKLYNTSAHSKAAGKLFYQMIDEVCAR